MWLNLSAKPAKAPNASGSICPTVEVNEEWPGLWEMKVRGWLRSMKHSSTKKEAGVPDAKFSHWGTVDDVRSGR